MTTDPQSVTAVNDTPEAPTRQELQQQWREELRRKQLLVAALGAASKKLTEEYDRLREELAAETEPGTTRPTFSTGSPDEVAPLVAGEVIHVGPGTRLKVTDQKAFAAWMIETHPDETTVSPTRMFWEALKTQCQQVGRVVGFNGETEIPGLTMVPSGDFVYAKANKNNLVDLLHYLRNDIPNILER